MNAVLTTINLFSYTVIMVGTSPMPQPYASRVMPGYEFTDQFSTICDDDRELTQLAMSLSNGSLSKVWDNDKDEHWDHL